MEESRLSEDHSAPKAEKEEGVKEKPEKKAKKKSKKD
jgi:hypothetical protein